MKVRINPHHFSATVKIPASKSHTIRRLLIAALADGVSEIKYPLDSLDTRSCVSVCRAFGAEITECRAAGPANPHPAGENGEKLLSWIIKGNNNFKNRHAPLPAPHAPLPAPHAPPAAIDVGNSGTTLYLALAAAGLQADAVEFTGDEQIRRRSAAPLLEALAGLGVRCESGNGCAPITVKGPWKGGKVSLPCPTSQYLSALLIASPLAPAGVVTEIDVPLLNERPYVEMTLSYLRTHGIPFHVKNDFSHFVIPGGSSWKGFSGSVPGDFSSAAFPAAAAAITGGPVSLLGLDPRDTQGDKFFLKMLESMGCEVRWNENNGEALPPTPAVSEALLESMGCDVQWNENNGEALPPTPAVSEALLESMGCDVQWNENGGEALPPAPAVSEALPPTVTISRKGSLRGGTFDLNETPDLLPAAAVTAAYAQGGTALVNVAHARIKETDRIAVMAGELAKLGVKCTERPDGLVIHGKGALFSDAGLPPKEPLPVIDSRGDHRIVMAFAAAALGSPVPVEITRAESAAVTYPGFLDLLGAREID